MEKITDSPTGRPTGRLRLPDGIDLNYRILSGGFTLLAPRITMRLLESTPQSQTIELTLDEDRRSSTIQASDDYDGDFDLDLDVDDDEVEDEDEDDDFDDDDEEDDDEEEDEFLSEDAEDDD